MRKLKKIFLIIGVTWLLLIFLNLLITNLSVNYNSDFLGINKLSGDFGECNISLNDNLYVFVIAGVPSWILFIAAIFIKDKPKTIKKKK